MARTGVFSLRRNAHLHQGKEGRTSRLRRRGFQAQAYQVHAKRLYPHQKAPKTGRIQLQ